MPNNYAPSIKQLNIILGNEFLAVHQYFMHGKLLNHWGFCKLAAKLEEESFDELKHASKICERILSLNGHPKVFELPSHHKVGSNPKQTLECDLKLEKKAIKDLINAIECLEKQKDYASRDLLQNILIEEEAHAGWVETQLGLIESLGIENYLQLQL